MKYLAIVICINLLSSYAKAYDLISDATNCSQGTFVHSEINSLLNIISNEVLGSVPRFCRSSEYEQLLDQVDRGQRDLSDFVVGLKNIKTNKKNIVNSDITTPAFLEASAFQTMKFVILKNKWKEQSPENQRTLLLEGSCSLHGINRLTTSASISTTKNNRLKETEKLNQHIKICEAEKIGDLTAYMSNDVLAEFFLNMKSILPESYDDIQGLLCRELLVAEDLLLKNKLNDNFEHTKISIKEIEEFGEWYKSVYLNINNQDMLIETAQEKMSSLKSDSPDGMSLLDAVSVDPSIKIYKEKDEYFNKYSINGGPVLHREFPGYELVKNSKGIVVFKMLDKYKKNQQKMVTEARNQNNEMSMKYIVKALENVEKKLDLDSKKEKNEWGIKVKKDFNNKFEVIYPKELAQELKAKALEQEKLMESYQKGNKKNLTQSELKAMYEIQMNDKNFIKDMDEFYGESFLIIKEDDGSYRKDSSMKIPKMLNPAKVIPEETLKLLSQKHNPEIIPSEMDGYHSVKIASGKYVQVYLGGTDQKSFDLQAYDPSEDKENEESNHVKYEHLIKISEAVKMTYQNTPKLVESLKKLSDEELMSLKGYTGQDFTQLNSCLRNKNCEAEENEKIKNIISGLNKIQGNEKEEKYLYRGFGKIPGFIQEQLDAGAQGYTLDAGFMSATGDIHTAKSFAVNSSEGEYKKGTIVIMKTKSCVGISAISSFSTEDEFLCPPGLKFNIKKLEKENAYYLEEVK